MAKVIIGIHGLGNKPRKEILEDWWKKSMIEGLDKLSQPYKLPHFELVYWADILYNKPLDEIIKDENDPFFLKERYVSAQTLQELEDNSLRQRVLDFLEEQLDKLFLNEDLTINYTGISDAIIHRYFNDLETYYAEECLDENDVKCMARALIRERLVEVLDKYKEDEIILIAHSMGSIIAYDTMTFLLPNVKIDTFITIGSPLGFPVVQGKIASEWHKKRLVPARLKTPPGIKRYWYNFADLRDKVALIYKLEKNFQRNYRGVKVQDFIVNNDYQIGDETNHHKSFGYLRTKELAKVLLSFSQDDHQEKSIFQRISSIFRT